ncbi:hypothetical protein B0H13DRAFT_1896071 [Mycena leptocephala]|nr:hypothetical protein B0H13DRAFT_1896071 [Mycena leptocephala]
MTVGVRPTFACVTSFLWDLQLLVSAADWTEKLEPDFIASHQHLTLRVSKMARLHSVFWACWGSPLGRSVGSREGIGREELKEMECCNVLVACRAAFLNLNRSPIDSPTASSSSVSSSSIQSSSASSVLLLFKLRASASRAAPSSSRLGSGSSATNVSSSGDLPAVPLPSWMLHAPPAMIPLAPSSAADVSSYTCHPVPVRK